MLVANMNLHEAYASLMADKKKLEWKRDALFLKAGKEINRAGTFPGWVMYEYQLPSSNNHYILYFYREHPMGTIFGGFLCVLFDGAKRFILKWTHEEKPEIHVFTRHFLQRYKERFLRQPDLSANEVAVRYLTRNTHMHPITVDERISKRIAEYGEYAAEGFLVTDGFCFKLSGEEVQDDQSVIRISLFTTFMPLTEMTDAQREAIFEECLKDVDNLRV